MSEHSPWHTAALVPSGPPALWGACSASCSAASLLLHLTCHLVASQVENSLFNVIYRHAASARRSVHVQLAVEGHSPGTSTNPPRQGAAQTPCPRPSLSPHWALRHPGEFPPLGPCLQLSPVFWPVQSLPGACTHLPAHLTPLPHDLNQISGREEVVHFTFKHPVMADTHH